MVSFLSSKCAGTKAVGSVASGHGIGEWFDFGILVVVKDWADRDISDLKGDSIGIIAK